MDLATFHPVLTTLGQDALRAATALAPTPESFLRDFRRLAKPFGDALARAALETALLRIKAKAKFARADSMFFTREALEQSSGEAVARRRAERFRDFNPVADLCCGIGGDTLALAAVTATVAVELDPLRLAMARANADACGLADRVTFVAGDVLTVALPPVRAVFLDPDRRADGRRHLAPRHYAPPPAAVLARLPAGLPLGVKVAPGVSHEDLSEFDAEREFISVGSELKECVLWFGPLRTARRRATVLPAGATLAADGPSPPPDIAPPRAYLYDPDPAVARAGLVTDLGAALGARQLDPTIAFLTSERLEATPFARVYAVEEAMPFHAKQLAAWLRARGVGRVTILKRGSAVDPTTLLRQLKPSGPEGRHVVLTRAAGRPLALIARPAAERDVATT